MSNLHRLTVVAYAFMVVSSAWSAALPTGHVWHILNCVVWVGLTGLAWHNGRNDARLREAARLSAMADGMSSVAGGVRRMSGRIGDVAEDIAAAALGAAAETRAEAIKILGGNS